ncbi:Uncharacterized protein GBIM_03436 [Gryllus bimaculatus]|nr:Uncharacterized protein GBIM_03436 [Gryllus bimaculatus]
MRGFRTCCSALPSESDAKRSIRASAREPPRGSGAAPAHRSRQVAALRRTRPSTFDRRRTRGARLLDGPCTARAAFMGAVNLGNYDCYPIVGKSRATIRLVYGITANVPFLLPQELQVIHYGLQGLEALACYRDSLLRALCRTVRYERHDANDVLYYVL